MTYGAEAVIPLETGLPTMRTSSFCPDTNNNLLEKNLDLIEEKKENAMVRTMSTSSRGDMTLMLKRGL